MSRRRVSVNAGLAPSHARPAGTKKSASSNWEDKTVPFSKERNSQMLEQIDRDIKNAMLSGDKLKAETLRGLKSAILNETIAQGAKDSGLSDEQIQKVLGREAKKRQEAADLYARGGSAERAEAELAEKAIIDSYLPEQVDDSVIVAAVSEEIAKLDSPQLSDMGKVIGAVKAKLGASADGATIARIAKEKLSQ